MEEEEEDDEDEGEEDEIIKRILDEVDEDKHKKNKKDQHVKQKPSKINMIFTIGVNEKDDDGEWSDYDDEDEYDDDDEETENEDESVSTVSSYDSDEEREAQEAQEDKEAEEVEAEEEEDEERKRRKNNKVQINGGKKRKSRVQKQSEDIEEEEEDDEDVRQLIERQKRRKEKEGEERGEKEGKAKMTDSYLLPETTEDVDLTILTQLKQLYESHPNPTLKECINICEKKYMIHQKYQEKKMKKQKAKNLRIFQKMSRDKNTLNDFRYFDTLEVESQKKIIKELRTVNTMIRVEKPYKITLLESNVPLQFKAEAMKKINSLRFIEPGIGEYYKIKNWVDSFMRIPFGLYKTLPIQIEDGMDKCHDFMENAQKTLNQAVYGLSDAKMQIMQMLGQLVTNPSAIGSSIAIHGPPGTGKTSLVKEGVSKILDRPFAFIALGGATDSSFLEGHSYTYEGSMWGKIVQILIDSKCMNPVIYFDELDKISDTSKGEEIVGILTHLTDTSQNSQFHDKYFSEFDFDLSKCLFIFSYNDESKINPILKDRMYRIQTKGYDKKEKTVISRQHLLPKIREQVKFTEEEVVFSDEIIHYIIEHHCNNEDGVRNMKRCFEIIFTKLNLIRLMKPDSLLLSSVLKNHKGFPVTITKEIVDEFIKSNKNENQGYRSMYV